MMDRIVSLETENRSVCSVKSAHDRPSIPQHLHSNMQVRGCLACLGRRLTELLVLASVQNGL